MARRRNVAWLVVVSASLAGASLMAVAQAFSMDALLATGATGMAAADEPSRGLYRLPFVDGTEVKVFDDATTHRPKGRVDLFAIDGKAPFHVVAAAAGRIVAIQDGHAEQQSGRAAKDCHNNYVWIEHPNGEWTNYSHLRKGSATGLARIKVGDRVEAGRWLGDEGAVGCAMLEHVHFEVAQPARSRPIDAGGFLRDNDDAKRERTPRFCTVPGEVAVKDHAYTAGPCPASAPKE